MAHSGGYHTEQSSPSISAVNPTTPQLPDGCAVVEEVPVRGLPAVTHPGWARAYPWLVQGTTVRGDGTAPFDLGMFSHASPARTVMEGWERLRAWSGLERAVHAHQVHEATVRAHGAGSPGLHVAPACDGHATGDAGVLLAVTVADCVPVFLVSPVKRAVALLHAGWRGAAAGILEVGLSVMASRWQTPAGDVLLHLGPSICGQCYEVGPEVFTGLGLPAPSGPAPVDLRAALARRGVEAGVAPHHLSVSAHCTLCGPGDLFSHRGGDGFRQVGFLGTRP